MNIERSPREILALLGRRWHQVAAVALGALLVASSFAVVKPRSYRSYTRLRIEGVGGNRDGADDVLGAGQDIKNFQNFDGVVADLNLDAHLQGLPEHERNQRRAELITGLQQRTEVTYEQSSPGVFILTLAHHGDDPELCTSIVSKLATSYQNALFINPVEQQQKKVEQQREAEEEALRKYQQIESELKAFENENAEFLEGPEQRLGAVRDQIEEIEKVEIASLEAQLIELAEHLAVEPEHDIQYIDEVDQDLINAIELDIRQLDRELKVLTVEQRKTEHHPQVQAKLEIIADHRAKRDEAKRDVKTRAVKTPNPMYQSLQEEWREKESQLMTARHRLALLRNKEAELKQDVQRAPEIRSRRDRMLADQTQRRQRYEDRQNDHSNAQDQLMALRNQRTLTVDTVDPATRPTSPTGPSAILIALMGLAVGVGAGAGLALVLDTMDSSFREVDQVSSYLGVPALGAIHMIRTPTEEAAKVRRARQIQIGLVLLGLAGVGLLMFAMFGDVSALTGLVKGAVK